MHTLAKSGLAAIAIAGAAAFAVSTSAAINSNLYIPKAETFVLGGKQPGAFTVTGRNRGKVAVEVLARADGEETYLAKIAPGERFKQGFAQGEGALLRNTSDAEQAYVKVRITGTTSNLGMSYRPNE